MDEVNHDTVKDEVAEVNEPTTPKRKSTKKISVTLINAREYNIAGITHYLAVTNQGELEGYLVPASDVKYDTTNPQDLKNPDQYTRVYGWSDEIDAMLPDMDTIRRNILLSFWKAGAISTEVQNDVKRRMLASAFPYPIPFKENE